MILKGLEKDLQLRDIEDETQQSSVLVIDDQESQRRYLSQILETAGYQVAIAENAQAGYLKLGLHRSSLVLVDCEMPGTNGLQFAHQIRLNSDFDSTEIVMVTSRRSKKIVQAAMSVGIIDFIAKPVERKMLLDKVAKILSLEPV